MIWFSAKLIDAKNRLVSAGRKSITGNEEGATAVEYALMVGLIAVVIIATVTALGAKINVEFDKITTALP